MKARYLVLLLTLIAVPQLIAQPYCTSGNGSIPLGGVCGFIKKYTPSGWVEPSTSYTEQICTLDAKGKRTWCGNYNTFHSCDFLGQNCGAEFYAAGIAAPNTQVALYSWNDAEFYGNTSPALLTG